MKNCIIKSFVFTLCFIAFNSNVIAQCSEIYFYRMNSLMQSDRAVYLYQDGELIATVKQGDRYKAEVCSSGRFVFSAKMDPNNVSLAKQTLEVNPGENYHFKISCPITPEIAALGKRTGSKGRKDLSKGNKFRGAVKRISLKMNNNPSSQPIVTNNGNNGGGAGTTFQKTQIVNNFKFEIVNITKAGGLMVLDYKITNLAADDRNLSISQPSVYFYDDLGNLVYSEQVCIATSCNYAGNGGYNPRTLKDQYGEGSVNYHAQNLMPSQIPLNAKIIIDEINTRSKKFVRGAVWFKAEQPFKIEYNNIVFPEIIDANNAMKRNFGSQSMELMSINRDGQNAIFHFKHYNQGDQVYKIDIKQGSFYDNEGHQYPVNAVTYVSKENRTRKDNSAYAWNKEVNSNSSVDVFVFVDNISNSSNQFLRTTLQFPGFQLSWENVDIKGQAASIENETTIVNVPPMANYIHYVDFETKVRNNESVIGKKIILENIYFNSGSDDVLASSHPQLDQLTQVLQSNSGLKLEVSGHTDNVGDNLPNMLLSQKRADSIRYYLIGKSIDPSRITSVGKGATQAIANNSSDTGRQQNRRVEIQIVE